MIKYENECITIDIIENDRVFGSGAPYAKCLFLDQWDKSTFAGHDNLNRGLKI